MKEWLFSIPLALVGSALCLSAASIPVTGAEIAMNKCTRDAPVCTDEQEEPADNSCNTCGNGEQSSATQEVKTERKSAARKVIEGN